MRLELHCHTVASHDGRIEFDSLLTTAARLRLDAVAITDHDTVAGAHEVLRLARRRNSPVQIIVGEERTLSTGCHLIGLFLREAIASTSLEDAIREIRDQGGLCVFPHPFRRDGGAAVYGVDAVSLAGVGFEIHNPKCSYDQNQKARALLSTAAAPVGGSDAHYESDMGECVTTLPRGDIRESIAAALRGEGAIRVEAAPQTPGGSGRRYAPAYYRIKPYIRVPRPLLPLAHRAYRAFRNAAGGLRRRELIEVYARG